MFPSHPFLGMGGALARDKSTDELLTTQNYATLGFFDPNDPQEVVTPVPNLFVPLASWVAVEDSGDILRVDVGESHVLRRVDRTTGATTVVHSFAYGSGMGDLEAVVLAPRCSDGFDNDGDGMVDLADPGCKNNPLRDSEKMPPCSSSISGINGELVIPALLLLFVFRAFARRDPRLA